MAPVDCWRHCHKFHFLMRTPYTCCSAEGVQVSLWNLALCIQSPCKTASPVTRNSHGSWSLAQPEQACNPTCIHQSMLANCFRRRDCHSHSNHCGTSPWVSCVRMPALVRSLAVFYWRERQIVLWEKRCRIEEIPFPILSRYRRSWRSVASRSSENTRARRHCRTLLPSRTSSWLSSALPAWLARVPSPARTSSTLGGPRRKTRCALRSSPNNHPTSRRRNPKILPRPPTRPLSIASPWPVVFGSSTAAIPVFLDVPWSHRRARLPTETSWNESVLRGLSFWAVRRVESWSFVVRAFAGDKANKEKWSLCWVSKFHPSVFQKHNKTIRQW